MSEQELAADDLPHEAPADVSPRRRGRWPLLLIALAALGGGGWYAWTLFMATPGQDGELVEERAGKRAQATYLALDPPLVVNFAADGRLRYLQVSIEVMTLDGRSADLVRRHAPALRHRLISLFSERDYEALLTREGKEALRQEAIEAMRHELQYLAGQGAVEDAYFSSFVMQ